MSKVKIKLFKAEKEAMVSALFSNDIEDYSVKTVSDTEVEFTFKAEPIKLFELGTDFEAATKVQP